MNMNIVSVDLENCFGIGKLKHDFDFTKNNAIVLYAPNGTMKTSFAKTFSCIARNQKSDMPRDTVYPERPTKYLITADTKDLPPESIFVIDAENKNFDSSEKITAFLASKELKNEYDSIYNELNVKLNVLIKALKNISQSTDCESELIDSFSETKEESIFDVLSKLEEKINTNKFIKYSFRYNDVFDKKGKVKAFIDKNRDDILAYFTKYEELLNSSAVFKKSNSGKIFGTYNLTELMASVDDDAFFEVGHRITLGNNIQIQSADKFHKISDSEIKRIVTDQELKKIFDKIDKSLRGNAELRAFQTVIAQDNTLLAKLINYDDFKQEVWLGFISSELSLYNDLTTTYNQKKVLLEKVFSKADEEQRIWNEIITLFNSRFHVPFSVEIKNQRDLILKKKTAALTFKYRESGAQAVEKEKEQLLAVLSRGERRAFYILQMIFEIEARKNYEDNLLIFDDISDSFDYKNKYAIIEYLYDIMEHGAFKLILLTHNFDFYRTIVSRFGLCSDNRFLTHKSSINREIMFKEGEYTKDLLAAWLKKLDKKRFISLIPFARNIVSYLKGDKSQDYQTLTACLHKKKESENVRVAEIVALYNSLFSELKDFSIDGKDIKIIDYIISLADLLEQEVSPDSFLLENKILLAIATRLQAENFLFSKMPDIQEPAGNQTRCLIKEYKERFPADSKSIYVLHKVNLMTPEHIHVNAFMYEPLIDMSMEELLELYKEVRKMHCSPFSNEPTR